MQVQVAEVAEEEQYAVHVHGYLAVIKHTLVSETAIRYMRYLTDLLCDNVQVAAGCYCIMTGSMSLGEFFAFR